MRTSLRQFGELVTAYRRNIGLTQLELAARISPPTNRSVVAHLEQGLRIPPPRVLSDICDLLQIPLQLWESFLEPGNRRIQPRATFQVRSFRLLGVAGISGSGKTTLARSLARALGVAFIPESRIAKEYLADIVVDPSRWALETQVAFLAEKAIHLLRCWESDLPAVLDRTLSEDAEVYARHFTNTGHIDPRSAVVYRVISEYFLEALPSPDLTILCHCSLATSMERIRSRARADIGHHDEAFLSAIHALHTAWTTAYSDSPVYTIDSDVHDFRDARTIELIAHDVADILSTQRLGADQLSLFDSQQSETLSLRILRQRLSAGLPARALEPAPTLSGSLAPSVYIAAPFSSAAAAPTVRKGGLFALAPRHGVIPVGAFRTQLLAIEKAFQALGFETVLPHRDVNRWGKRILTPEQAMTSCTRMVARSDVIAVILGTSPGAHYELGLARGLGKPCIIVACGGVESSFLAEGAGSLENADTLVLRCATLDEVSSKIGSEETRQFLARHV